MPPKRRRASRARAGDDDDAVDARAVDDRDVARATASARGVERRTIAIASRDAAADATTTTTRGVVCVDGACVARCVEGAVTVGGYALRAVARRWWCGARRGWRAR